jgi:hypothetical protein
MERSSKRGKIPQSDWPLIIKRYEAGETLAAIARTYDCSPPAISYILSRSRARDASVDGVVHDTNEPSQPSLMKTPMSDTPLPTGQGDTGIAEAAVVTAESQASAPIAGHGHEPPQAELTHLPIQQADPPDRRDDVVATGADSSTQRRFENGDSADPPREGDPPPSNLARPILLPQNDEPRHTLHLPISQHGNHRSDPQVHGAHGSDPFKATAIQPVRDPQQGSITGPSRQGSDHHTHHTAMNNSGAARAAAEPATAKEGGAFIDRALRERVDEDIAAFLAAFDAALAGDSLESRLGLREATDRLLRAGARTRIELERLEARVPLPARENGGRPTSNWRPR